MPQPSYDQSWLENYAARAKGSVKARLEQTKGFATAKCDVSTGFVLPVPKKPKPKALNPLVLAMVLDAGLPEPTAEFRFVEDRKFAFDFAWVEQKIALEAEGMVHRIKDRYLRDVEKYNLATALGWRVLRATRQQIKNPNVLLAQLCELLKGNNG
jgi:hypothetical protein